MAVRMKSVRFAKKPSLTSRSISPRSISPTLIVIFSLFSTSDTFFSGRILILSPSDHHPNTIQTDGRMYARLRQARTRARAGCREGAARGPAVERVHALD